MGAATINKLQLLQQNLQQILLQKQQLGDQVTEIDSALHELKTTDKAYRIIGKIMLSTPTETLSKDLEERREVTQVRLRNFDKQEEKIKQNMQDAQQEVMRDLKPKKN